MAKQHNHPPRRPRGGQTMELRRARLRLYIGCGGEETEPNYIDGLVKWLLANGYSNTPIIQTEGLGRDEMSLVEKVRRIDSFRAYGPTFDAIYIVLDHDCKTGFDAAIRAANKSKYTAIWSNQCIELWFYLHFHYHNTATPQGQYLDLLDKALKSRGYAKGYDKKDAQIAAVLMEKGKVKLAIENARKLCKETEAVKDYAQRDPATNMHELICRIFDEAKYRYK